MRRLEPFFDGTDRAAYLIVSGTSLAGLALVRGVTVDARVMGDFFVLRGARRHGVGHIAALQLPSQYPGTWEIPFQDENPAAARFWRRTATAAVGDAWTEERRPVPGKPHLPHDMWIRLTCPSVRTAGHGTR